MKKRKHAYLLHCLNAKKYNPLNRIRIGIIGTESFTTLEEMEITVLTQRRAEDPQTEQNPGVVSLYGMRGQLCTHKIVFRNSSASQLIFLVE